MSILVTEPSPEIPTTSTVNLQIEPASTLVHVLVHRESEEYQTDLEDGSSLEGKGKLEIRRKQNRMSKQKSGHAKSGKNTRT